MHCADKHQQVWHTLSHAVLQLRAAQQLSNVLLCEVRGFCCLCCIVGCQERCWGLLWHVVALLLQQICKHRSWLQDY
jgi:hypothetical protein